MSTPETYPSAARRTLPTLRTVSALMLREMSMRYGQSVLGYFWALLSPLVMIVVLTIAFSFLQKSPRLGTSFIMYYASGHLVFALFGQISGPLTSALKFSRPLLRFPTVLWLDTFLARFLLNGVTALVVFFGLLYGIAWYSGHGVRFDLAPVLVALGLSVALGFGFGVLTCYVFLEAPLIGRLWGFASRPLFIASGVLFLYEDFPEGMQSWLYWNPLMHVTSLARSGVFSGYDPGFVSVPFVALVALSMSVLGLLLVRQHHHRLLNTGD